MKTHKVQVGNLYFSAAHFLIGKDFGVEALHGHNFCVEVSIENVLDDEGIVIDFVRLKVVAERVLAQLDHRLLIPSKNPRLNIKNESELVTVSAGKTVLRLKGSNVLSLPFVNTSAELIAEYIAQSILDKLREVNLVSDSGKIKVKVSEEPGCSGSCKFQF